MVGPKQAVRPLQLLWLVVLLIIVLPSLGWAALGGDEASVQSDQSQMGAAVRITRTSAYAVHELQAPGGPVVREYISPSGTVFGVAWQGAAKPDLRQLLGSHYDDVQQALPGGTVKRGPIVIHQPGLVFEMGGHMRAIAGRAYLPQLLPSGVQADAIR